MTTEPSTHKRRETILREEAAFADGEYEAVRTKLELPQILFDKYTKPQYYYRYEFRMGQLLGEVAGRRFLDLGCGTGQEAVYFALQGANVTAIDISPVGIELTQIRAKR
jgi:2-polyprenyl-3-methyl-5-hydroxy-6-metoxy-1,4-benzoquinol methylase